MVSASDVRAQQEVLLEDNASPEEIIEMLKPRKDPRFRGLQRTFVGGPKEASAPPASRPQHPPSASLQVFFDFNSSDLKPEAVRQLDGLAQALASEHLQPYRYRVEGHTDAAGSDTYNQWLSEQRARTVSEHLIKNYGIERSRLEAVGLGESDLYDSENPRAAINRRVRITYIGN